MSRINSNGKREIVESKTKAKKAFGEQSITLTHRERPYMSPYDYAVDPMAMEASLLTIRECSEKVTDIATESIYPARVNDEVALGS